MVKTTTATVNVEYIFCSADFHDGSLNNKKKNPPNLQSGLYV